MKSTRLPSSCLSGGIRGWGSCAT